MGRFINCVIVAPLALGCGDKDDSGVPTPDSEECAETGFLDGDGDGYGATEVEDCDDDSTVVDLGGDCDDADPDIHPAAQEVCDGVVDEDCDGLVDEADDSLDVSTQVGWYIDDDGDGYGALEEAGCIAPSGSVELGGDCDDGDPDVHPAATEVCDDLDTDEDCNGLADDADDGLDPDSAESWMVDADGDGFGDDDSVVIACEGASGDVTTGGDCDDTRDDVNPDAREVCDDLDTDEDCDGRVDDDDNDLVLDTQVPLYMDGDGDGYGAGEVARYACDADAYTSVDDTDCDDSEATVSPGATEDCSNGVDDDCNGLLDCEDGSCSNPCTETTCDDSLDEDLDGDTDCADEDCMGLGVCRVQTRVRVASGQGSATYHRMWDYGGDCSATNILLSTARGTFSSVRGTVLATHGTGTTATSSTCTWAAQKLSWNQQRAFSETGQCHAGNSVSSYTWPGLQVSGLQLDSACGLTGSQWLPPHLNLVSGAVQAIEARGFYPSPSSGASWLQPTSAASWQRSNTSWVNSNSSYLYSSFFERSGVLVAPALQTGSWFSTSY